MFVLFFALLSGLLYGLAAYCLARTVFAWKDSKRPKCCLCYGHFQESEVVVKPPAGSPAGTGPVHWRCLFRLGKETGVIVEYNQEKDVTVRPDPGKWRER